MYYVYIIQSELDGDLYKGSTQNYLRRVEEHNLGGSQFTRHRRPWKLIFAREFQTRREALIEEKRLKRTNRVYLEWLVNQPFNLVRS
jgi:putative endonuclease